MTEQLSAEVEAGGFDRLDLRVRVPAATVGAAYARVLRDARRGVQVAGYRVGKAPLSAVRRRVGNHLSRMVAAQLVKDNADKAARAKGLPPLGQEPEAYSSGEAVEGQVFEFRVRLNNIRARVTKLEPAYNNLRLVMPPPLQTDYDALVEQQLQLFLSQCAASRERSEDELVEAGDRVAFSCRVVDDEQPRPQEFEQGQTQTVIVGVEERLPGGLERSLQHLSCGGTRRISRIIKRRDNWGDSHLEGRKVTFDLKVHKAEQLSLPELNDALVQQKTGNVPSVEALRSRLRQGLVDKEDAARRQWMESQVASKLMTGSEVEIPQLLLDHVAEYIYRGHKPEEIAAQQQSALRQACLEQAQELIAITAVLEEVARRENIAAQAEGSGMTGDRYHDLRRVVAQHLVSKSELIHPDADEDEDEDAEAQRDADSERLYTLQHTLHERSQVKKLADYKNFPLEVPATHVGDEMIELRLEALRHEYAAYHILDAPVTRGIAQNLVVTRFVIVGDEVVPEMNLLRSLQSFPAQAAELPPHLQVFVGMRPGESKKVLCPEMFPEAAERGLKVEINAALHEVHKLELPTLDDRFAQEFLGIDSLTALRAQITEEVERSQKQTQQRLLGEHILKELAAKSELQMDTEMQEKSVLTVLNSASLRGNFGIEKNASEEVAAARARDIITIVARRYLVAAEIARRENIAYDDEAVDEGDRLLAKVEKFLLKEAKIVDDAGG